MGIGLSDRGHGITMALTDHPKAYGTAAITVAFTAGILVTLGFKDLYPDLEARYQQRRRRPRRSLASSSSKQDLRPRRDSLFFGPVFLQDRESAELDSQSIVDGLEGCIGETPLVRIKSLSDATGREILGKAEFLNGAGNSPKDRVALNMIKVAEEEGILRPGRGDTIYEGTVGSTGISLATLARAKGYRAHICMPDDQSREKSDLLTHLGAHVERVPVAPITSPSHFVNLARRRAAEHAALKADGSVGFFADQFESGSNHAAHASSTGPEIFSQTGGRLDAFVSGAGTGGTLSGVARHLKNEMKMGNLKVILADPQGSGLYNKVRHGVMYSPTEREGTRRRQQVDSLVEGVGINRMTANFEAGRELVDDAVRVTDEQAARMARWLVEKDGMFLGSSSAVNCVAAVVAAMGMPEGSRVVTVLCDPGTRHLSKFWKHIAEMGLEGEEEGDDLFAALRLTRPR